MLPEIEKGPILGRLEKEAKLLGELVSVGLGVVTLLMLINMMEWLEAAGIVVGIVYVGCILWFTTILEEADAIYYRAA